MYKIISALNGFIREEMIPNPYEFISDNQLIVILFTYLIGEMILHIISFSIVGIFYRRGQAPVLGSIGYMMAFGFNVWVIKNISNLFNSVLLISIIYSIISIMVFKILYKIKEIVFMS